LAVHQGHIKAGLLQGLLQNGGGGHGQDLKGRKSSVQFLNHWQGVVTGAGNEKQRGRRSHNINSPCLEN
jgi:hypothetical protein